MDIYDKRYRTEKKKKECWLYSWKKIDREKAVTQNCDFESLKYTTVHIVILLT